MYIYIYHSTKVVDGHGILRMSNVSNVQMSITIIIYNFVVVGTLVDSSFEAGSIGGGSKDSSPLKCLISRNELASAPARLKYITHHPLCAPPLRKLQSPFPTQSHPPATPFPPSQSGTLISDRRALVPGASNSSTVRVGPLVVETIGEEVLDAVAGVLRKNVLNPAVKTLKSSSALSSGILPVNTRPIAIRGAACEQISTALLVFCSCWGWDAS